MTITINKDSFPRFAKRLKKSLQKNGIDLPLNKVQEVAAQSLGKENYHELNTLFNHEQNNLTALDIADELPTKSNESPISLTKDYDWIIEEASLQIGMSMGRPGWAIGSDHIKTAINKALQHTLSKNSKITLNLGEVENLVECYDNDFETDITISRFKEDNKLYCWYSEYPEEGRIVLETKTTVQNELKTLTTQLQLPTYQNHILCILGGLIINNKNTEQLIEKANDITNFSDLMNKSSSYAFYTNKSPFFSDQQILSIIRGHKTNLTVMVALLDYIKKNMPYDTIKLEYFNFVQKCSPLLWDLISSYHKPKKSEHVKEIINIYKQEKNINL